MSDEQLAVDAPVSEPESNVDESGVFAPVVEPVVAVAPEKEVVPEQKPEPVQATLFERIGGEAAVNAAVDIFYDKVLSDYRINRYFGKTDMTKQAQHLKAFMTLAFGGPDRYTGRSLRDSHARLVSMGLNDMHYDCVMEHLGATLQELNVPDAIISEAAALVESVRDEVLGR